MWRNTVAINNVSKRFVWLPITEKKKEEATFAH